MQKLHYSIQINAPASKVFRTMLEKETYHEWTKAFYTDSTSASTYEGSWDLGSEIKFIGTDKDGSVGGIAGKIVENIPNEFISIEYTGLIAKDGSVDSTSDAFKEWAGTLENYRFTEENGGTRLDIDFESKADLAAIFEDMWTKGLQKLKEICES